MAKNLKGVINKNKSPDFKKSGLFLCFILKVAGCARDAKGLVHLLVCF